MDTPQRYTVSDQLVVTDVSGPRAQMERVSGTDVYGPPGQMEDASGTDLMVPGH